MNTPNIEFSVDIPSEGRIISLGNSYSQLSFVLVRHDNGGLFVAENATVFGNFGPIALLSRYKLTHGTDNASGFLIIPYCNFILQVNKFWFWTNSFVCWFEACSC